MNSIFYFFYFKYTFIYYQTCSNSYRNLFGSSIIVIVVSLILYIPIYLLFKNKIIIIKFTSLEASSNILFLRLMIENYVFVVYSFIYLATIPTFL